MFAGFGRAGGLDARLVELDRIGDEPDGRAAIGGFHFEDQVVGQHLFVGRDIEHRLVGSPLALHRLQALQPIFERMLLESFAHQRLRIGCMGHQFDTGREAGIACMFGDIQMLEDILDERTRLKNGEIDMSAIGGFEYTDKGVGARVLLAGQGRPERNRVQLHRDIDAARRGPNAG